MSQEQRKTALIDWINNLNNDALLVHIEEIIHLFEIPHQEKGRLIEHTSVRELLKNQLQLHEVLK